MTIEDLAEGLPNGFHDSKVHVASIDFDAQTAEFILDVWIGTMDSPPGPEREKYRRGRLELLGLEYLAMDPPHPKYPYRKCGEIDIDLCTPDEEVAGPRPHGEGGFAGSFFVSNWNAFIHFAAMDARLHWLEPG